MPRSRSGSRQLAIYNPLAATLGERAKQIEERIFGSESGRGTGTRFWVRQRSGEGQSVLHANASRDQGASLAGITVFVFDLRDRFTERIEADGAKLESGHWRLDNARIYTTSAPPREVAGVSTSDQSDCRTGAGKLSLRQRPCHFGNYRHISTWPNGPASPPPDIGYNTKTCWPARFCLPPWCLLASAVSLRFFRFGGVQRMVLCGVGAGFLLYVMSKVTEDLSKAELMHPVAAAWSPVIVGTLTGVVALLFQEDG